MSTIKLLWHRLFVLLIRPLCVPTTMPNGQFFVVSFRQIFAFFNQAVACAVFLVIGMFGLFVGVPIPVYRFPLPLPPRSPTFQPVEFLFSKIKHSIRKSAPRSQEDLEAAVKQAFKEVTQHDIDEWVIHTGYVRVGNKVIGRIASRQRKQEKYILMAEDGTAISQRLRNSVKDEPMIKDPQRYEGDVLENVFAGSERFDMTSSLPSPIQKRGKGKRYTGIGTPTNKPNIPITRKTAQATA